MKKEVHALDFKCQHVLKFLDRCNSCVKKGKCRERGLLVAILTNKKKLIYEMRKEDALAWSEVLKYCPHCGKELLSDSYSLHCECGFLLEF